MSSQASKKQQARRKRAMRVRSKLKGSSERPRLSVHKSNRHIQAQIIDDERGQTLVGLTTYSKDLKGGEHGSISKASAAEIGKQLAERAKGLQIEQVVLDRGSFKYHGVIAALADAAREAGLKF